MAEVVVSYAAADAARAKTLTEALEELGFGVVETRLGEPGPRSLPQIVLWSRAAMAGPRPPRSRDRLILARLDPVETPAIRGASTVNLQSWRGRPDHRGWRSLVAALAASPAATAAAAGPPPTVTAASSAPSDSEARKDKGKGWIIASAALKILALAGLGAGLYFAFRPG